MRADLYLSAFGHTPSRKKAQDLIAEGAVKIDGIEIKKPSTPVNEEVPHTVDIAEVFKYVSRGGMKLEAALNAFRINVNGKKAVDVGASTGGFTDCLLQRGAARVYSVDSGIGQLHEKLREDKRVVCIEKFNARELSAEETDGECDIATCDVSFISQTYIIPNIAATVRNGGELVSLIKPQFEAGRGALGKGGIVHSGAYRYLAVKRVIECALGCGLDCVGLIPSPIEGGDGNKEYLAYFVKRPCVRCAVDDKTMRFITR